MDSRTLDCNETRYMVVKTRPLPAQMASAVWAQTYLSGALVANDGDLWDVDILFNTALAQSIDELHCGTHIASNDAR